VTVVYAGRFFFASLSMFFTRAENLQYLWYQIYRLGMRPDVFYRPWLKFIVLTVLPAAMIASVPVRALLELFNCLLYLWAIVLSLGCIWLTTIHWRRALRSYTSASS
jgi:ABC-2 type transport system permease protein